MTENHDQNTLLGSEEDAPVHLIISYMKGNLYIKPSRPVNRQRLLGILMDTVWMMQISKIKTVHPEDCGLRVMLTVDDEQIEPEDLEAMG